MNADFFIGLIRLQPLKCGFSNESRSSSQFFFYHNLQIRVYLRDSRTIIKIPKTFSVNITLKKKLNKRLN